MNCWTQYEPNPLLLATKSLWGSVRDNITPIENMIKPLSSKIITVTMAFSKCSCVAVVRSAASFQCFPLRVEISLR
jgi:hypothetical protein